MRLRKMACICSAVLLCTSVLSADNTPPGGNNGQNQGIVQLQAERAPDVRVLPSGDHEIGSVLGEPLPATIPDVDKRDNPAFDPHGAPIPGRDGTIHRVDTRSLSSVGSGEKVEVVEVLDSDPGLLRYLGGLEMFPGTVVRIIEVEPYHGPLKIRSKGRDVVLGRRAAGKIRVKDVS